MRNYLSCILSIITFFLTGSSGAAPSQKVLSQNVHTFFQGAMLQSTTAGFSQSPWLLLKKHAVQQTLSPSTTSAKLKQKQGGESLTLESPSEDSAHTVAPPFATYTFVFFSVQSIFLGVNLYDWLTDAPKALLFPVLGTIVGGLGTLLSGYLLLKYFGSSGITAFGRFILLTAVIVSLATLSISVLRLSQSSPNSHHQKRLVHGQKQVGTTGFAIRF
mgnify:CR=1 FL=1